MNGKQKRKLLWMVLVALASMAVLGFSLLTLQNRLQQASQQEDVIHKLTQVHQLAASAQDRAASTRDMYDAIYQDKASTLAFMLLEGLDTRVTALEMEDYRRVLNVTNVLLLDREGRVLARAQRSPASFSRARYNQLRTVLDTGVPSAAFTVEHASGALRYYAAPVGTDQVAVVEQDPAELEQLMADTSTWGSMLSNVHVGLEGYAMAVSAKDYTLLYHPDPILIGEDALALGLSAAQLEDGAIDTFTLNGQELYGGVARMGEDAYVLCVLPQSEAAASRSITVGVVLFAFGVVMTLVICYAMFTTAAGTPAGTDTQKKPKKLVYHRDVARRIFSVSTVGLVCILVVSFYMQTLFALSQQSMSNTRTATDVEDTIDRYAQDVTLLTARYNRSYLSKAETAAYILTKRPALRTRSDLARLSDALGAEAVFVFDKTGVMTATNSPYSNFALSENPQDQSYAFRQLLQGVEFLVQEAQPDDISGTYHQYVGVGLRDAVGEVDGFVQISLTPTQLETAVSQLNITSILSNVRLGREGFAFAVDKATGEIAYHPQSKLIGRPALECGMTESQLRDSYSDYLTVNDLSLYGTSLETEHYYVYVVVPAEELSGTRIPVSIFSAGMSLICLLIICLMLSFSRPGSGKQQPTQENTQMVNVVMPDGAVRKTEAAASRWDSISVSWKNKTAEQKMFSVLKGLLAVLALGICGLILGQESLLGRDSVIGYVLSGRWARGVSVFSITGCLMIMCVASMATMFLQRLLMLMARTFDARTATICRLLSSALKYLSVLGQVYYCLALFGVDTATLLASAGILSLIVGLGSKELISDIIAGLFIIFEGEFRVGDIVTIGDWRGTVVEIGVRTTKVEAAGKDIKIFNNSAISGVINMTRQYSFASCDVGIEYGESLERVESILLTELPLMKKRLPAIKDGPFYKGVMELGDSSVNIKIVAQCAEADRIQLCRDLNREMKLLFDRYSINIPFPQVVLNQPPEFKEATTWQKKRAEAFNEQQKKLSKDIETTGN